MEVFKEYTWHYPPTPEIENTLLKKDELNLNNQKLFKKLEPVKDEDKNIILGKFKDIPSVFYQ